MTIIYYGKTDSLYFVLEIYLAQKRVSLAFLRARESTLRSNDPTSRYIRARIDRSFTNTAGAARRMNESELLAVRRYSIQRFETTIDCRQVEIKRTIREEQRHKRIHERTSIYLIMNRQTVRFLKEHRSLKYLLKWSTWFTEAFENEEKRQVWKI